MDDSPVGEQIAHYRRRLGLSQAELAALVGRSTGWLANIEQGSRGIERLSVLTKVAEALGVGVADLRPDAAGGLGAPAGDRDPTGLLAVLSSYPELAAASAPLGDLGELASSVGSLWDLAHQVAYRPLLERLAELLPALDIGAAQPHPGRSGGRWHQLRCEAYQVAAAALTRLGERAGAWVAADRAVSAALASRDPRLAASAVLRAAHMFLTDGRLIEAEHAASAVASLHTSHPAELSLTGAAQLVLAEVHARRGARELAHHYLDAATTLAETVGEGQDHFGTEFGPTNVGVHALHIAVALGDAGEAVCIASRLDVSGLSIERQARYFLDYARAELLRRQPREALRLLVRADELSSEQTSHEPDARDAIRDLGSFSQRVRGGGSKDLSRLRSRIEHPLD